MNYKIGNFKAELEQMNYDILLHGCNNRGAFGAGIAALVAQVHPKCKELYLGRIAQTKLKDRLGDTFIYTIHDDNDEKKYILNAIIQDGYGRDGYKYVSYDAVNKIFEDLADFAKGRDESQPDLTIAFPLVGAGLGGGEWSIIERIIDFHLKGLNYTCIVRREDIEKHNLHSETQAAELMAFLEAPPKVKEEVKKEHLDWFYKNVGG